VGIAVILTFGLGMLIWVNMEKITENNVELEDRKTYELGYLLSPLIPEETSEEASQNMVKAIIEGQGAEVVSQQSPRMKALAYPVSKTVGGRKSSFKQAYLASVRFNTEPAVVLKIKDLLDKEENVIRFLLIIAPKISERPVSVRRNYVSRPRSEARKEGSVKTEMNAEEIDKEIEGLISDKAVV
jgi:ribosomal protein S6